MKQSTLAMWFILLLGMIFGSGWVASVAKLAFLGIALVHFVEFFVKKSVLEKAGGSIGQHFLQSLIYGFFHWKPREEQHSSAAWEGP